MKKIITWEEVSEQILKAIEDEQKKTTKLSVPTASETTIDVYPDIQSGATAADA